ncbi:MULTISPECIES: GNAT family N-acetyltransferase [Inquilinus]|uniref:RimJ/RimL family protein N-acetyltransferase n=1 Tax=Inquilinus ginsengisoli TaxID=363840 RepID=A0ABU1JM06_9PROT|nr:GNAT family N-acetyltransferase [Inquilinus ginsengisoli]MDR6289645.1 RimJ/RimL family protein N-acetyltransferase [Inquilinus ginsengisoli]
MFTFTPLRPADLSRLRLWLMMPHVRAWWGDPDAGIREICRLMASDWAEPMLVAWQGRQIGYLQAYDAVSAAPDGDAVPGSFGIDLFIGEPSYVGKGLGTAFVGAYTDRLLRGGRALSIIARPAPANHRAIRCLEHAGFRLLGDGDGRVLTMGKDRSG